MNLTIQISGELEAALKAQAAARGLSADNCVNQILQNALMTEEFLEKPRKLNSLQGVLAKFGPAPSEEEIDISRAEMLRGFAEKF